MFLLNELYNIFKIGSFIYFNISTITFGKKTFYYCTDKGENNLYSQLTEAVSVVTDVS